MTLLALLLMLWNSKANEEAYLKGIDDRREAFHRIEPDTIISSGAKQAQYVMYSTAAIQWMIETATPTREARP